MTSIRTVLMACAGLAALSAAQVQAAVDEYSVGANSRMTINLELCSAETQLAVRGDTGTDLDFFLNAPDGTMIHSDEGLDDYLSYVVAKEGEGCATFTLGVSNLGDDSNTFTVLVEPITESSVRVQKYIVQGNATETVSFKACGTSAQVSARGDGDTDLDYVIRNADGAVVHEDEELSDETTAELAGLLSDCEVFEMDVANLGEVYNVVMVVVEPRGASTAAFAGTAPTTSIGAASLALDGSSRPVTVAETSGAGDYRAEANSVLKVNLPVCSATRLEVRGDGDTDLDFTVTDAAGNSVHSDFDLSDITFATLDPGSECQTYTVAVDNLGDVYNDFSIALIDPTSRTAAEGPGSYRVNASASTKVALRVCAVTKVNARGDGDTDLDFDVTDSDGESIHSDYDTTDRTEFTLDPGRNECADFQIAVENLGDVYNELTIAFDDDPQSFTARVGKGPQSTIAPPGPPIGFAKGVGNADTAERAITIQNRSGEALSSMFWSNSATFGWGNDMLGGESELAPGGSWEVDVADGSNACLFDFRAVTESEREILVRAVNVCDISSVTME